MRAIKKEVLFVDGYNMIGSWPDLVPLHKQNRLPEARDVLLSKLSAYSKYKEIRCIVVFDAQLVPGIQQEYAYKNLEVIFTQEDETADSYIERSIDEVKDVLTNVTVATSDYAEQRMVLGKGASRKPSSELYHDVQQVKKDVNSDYHEYRLNNSRRFSAWKDTDIKKLTELYEEIIKDD